MHLIFMARGSITQIPQFEMFLHTQMWAWDRINLHTGEWERMLVQGVLRKIPLGYEYIFPERNLREVLSMLHIRDKLNRWKLGNGKIMALRKMMGHGIKPIPEYEDIKTNRYIMQDGIALYPIGIKRDVWSCEVAKDYFQEDL